MNVLAKVSAALQAAGAVVDSLVPFGVGSRTQTSVGVATILPLLTSVFLKVAPIVATAYPAAAPVIAAIPAMFNGASAIAAALAPLFAAAGLARKLAPAPAPAQ